MPSSSPAVVCIGHVTLDLVTRIDGPPPDDARVLASDGTLSGGGPAATAAVAVARLGVPVAFLGTVGHDLAGDFVLEGLAREGVDVSGVRRQAIPTAVSSIWVDASSGHRSIAAFYREAGIDALTADDLELARAATWIHLDSPGFRAARLLRDAGVTTPIALDAGNPVPDLDLSVIDLYAPTEARLIERHGATVDAAMQQVLDAGPSLVVATRGRGGCIAGRRTPRLLARSALERVVVEAFDVPVVSTLGAGDVFHGALVAALARGVDLGDALTLGNAVAALSCRSLDGRSAIPTWDEALAFAAAHGRPIALPEAKRVAGAGAPS